VKICTKIQNKKRGICIGNFTEVIKIMFPVLTASNSGVDFTKPETKILETFAMVQTSRGTELFDGSNLSNAYTHIFYIRFNPYAEITTTCLIEYRAEDYKILDIENLDERNEILAFKCAKRGDSTLAVNKI
jgi:SPP1 family predicted phage head-tail adaptor